MRTDVPEVVAADVIALADLAEVAIDAAVVARRFTRAPVVAAASVLAVTVELFIAVVGVVAVVPDVVVRLVVLFDATVTGVPMFVNVAAGTFDTVAAGVADAPPANAPGVNVAELTEVGAAVLPLRTTGAAFAVAALSMMVPSAVTVPTIPFSITPTAPPA